MCPSCRSCRSCYSCRRGFSQHAEYSGTGSRIYHPRGTKKSVCKDHQRSLTPCDLNCSDLKFPARPRMYSVDLEHHALVNTPVHGSIAHSHSHSMSQYVKVFKDVQGITFTVRSHSSTMNPRNCQILQGLKAPDIAKSGPSPLMSMAVDRWVTVGGLIVKQRGKLCCLCGSNSEMFTLRYYEMQTLFCTPKCHFEGCTFQSSGSHMASKSKWPWRTRISKKEWNPSPPSTFISSISQLICSPVDSFQEYPLDTK